MLQDDRIGAVVLLAVPRQAAFAFFFRQLPQHAPRQAHQRLDLLPALFRRHAAIGFDLFLAQHDEMILTDRAIKQRERLTPPAWPSSARPVVPLHCADWCAGGG